MAKLLAHDFSKKFEVFGFYERELKELAAEGFPRFVCDRVRAAQNSKRFTRILAAFMAVRDVAGLDRRFAGLARTMTELVSDMWNLALKYINPEKVDRSVVEELNAILTLEVDPDEYVRSPRWRSIDLWARV